MVGEFPSNQGLVGVLLIVIGAYILNIVKARKGILKPFFALVKEKGLEQISEEGEIEKAIEEVIAENPKIVDDFKGGKSNAIMALVGKVMAKTKGKANARSVNEILRKLLKSEDKGQKTEDR